MKKKITIEQLEKIIIDNFSNESGSTIDLTGLNFGNKTVILKKMKASTIVNTHQKSVAIYNDFQQADYINNSNQNATRQLLNWKQTSGRDISNNFQVAGLEISNRNQKAKRTIHNFGQTSNDIIDNSSQNAEYIHNTGQVAGEILNMGQEDKASTQTYLKPTETVWETRDVFDTQWRLVELKKKEGDN